MRVAHVVTLISPDGAYGGPLRVALNQSKALADLGDEAVIFAGTHGYRAPPHEIDGIELRLSPTTKFLPGIGFAGLIAPQLNRRLKASFDEFDVIHVHVARDLITLPAARLALNAERRYVLQPHGMLDPSQRALSAPLDALVTRPVLRGAAAVLVLNANDRRDVAEVARGELPFVVLPNGVPIHAPIDPAAGNDEVEVLFLARLHERKRPVLFTRMAIVLAREFPTALFTLVGPDEGEGEAVTRLIDDANVAGRVRWLGALAPNETVARMRRAAIYVLPSVNEPFPMSVLEAMSVALPVVITRSNGLAESLDRHHSGMVIGESLEALINAVRDLLADPRRRSVLGELALRTVREHYSMPTIAEELHRVYRQVAG